MTLVISELHAGYGGSQVLAGVGFEVRQGQTVLLLGPNGHGKTTMLRVLSGLHPATAGAVTFRGRSLLGLPPDQIVRLGITHIPQGDWPFPQMTVVENLLMGAYLPSAWRRRREHLERTFELFPRLAERRSMLANTLSGGERRMLSLGRGLMGDPTLLLIDEPSLGLAPRLVTEVYEGIRRVQERHVAILLVDETANHAADLADWVCIMQTGRIARQGPAREVLTDEALMAAYLG